MRALTQNTSWRLGYFLLALSCMAFAVLGLRAEPVTLHSRDIVPVYTGARCLVQGCNPYSSAELYAEYRRAGGVYFDPVGWLPEVPIYPPTAFLALLPMAWLPWPVFHSAWLILTTLGLCFAAFLMADLCRSYEPIPGMICISFLVITSTLVIMLGQPAAIAASLLAFAIWAAFRQRFLWIGALAFAWAFALKPPMAAFLFLWLFFQPGFPRRIAWRSLATIAFLALVTLLLCAHNPAMAHWPSHLINNLRLASMPGHGLDPTITNPDNLTMTYLQTVLSLAIGHWAGPVAIAITLFLIAAWYLGHRRAVGSAPTLLLSLAALTAITFLPTYHREYDARLLLIAMPAVSVLATRGFRWKWSALAIAMLSIFLTWHKWSMFLFHHVLSQNRAVLAIIMRPAAWGSLVLSVYFTAALWALSRPRA